MKVSVLAAVVGAVGFGVLGWWLWTYHHASSATLIALGAFAVSCFAQFQASRSAHNAAKTSVLAQLNEERAKYGWTITVHPDGHCHVLRNTGTLTAHDVRFTNIGPQTFIQFEQHEGKQGPTIPRGQAVAFHATFTYGSVGRAVQFDWLPEGKTKRRTFKDVLEPIPNKQFDETVKRSEVERDADAAIRRQWCVEIRRHLIDLADAWAVFQVDATPQNKARVQALVSALPSNMVREMGFAVDVLRDYWGDNQWPLDIFVQDEKDKKLVHDNAPMIELMWNLTWVQIPQVAEADISQSPDPWYRIEHAVSGYVELVRNREQGKRELRDGPRDRKHSEEALKMIKQNEAMFPGHSQVVQQSKPD